MSVWPLGRTARFGAEGPARVRRGFMEEAERKLSLGKGSGRDVF